MKGKIEMYVKDLIKELQKFPEDALVYLDSPEMPTCLGLVHIELLYNRGFVMKTREEITIPTVTLATYNWRETDAAGK